MKNLDDSSHLDLTPSTDGQETNSQPKKKKCCDRPFLWTMAFIISIGVCLTGFVMYQSILAERDTIENLSLFKSVSRDKAGEPILCKEEQRNVDVCIEIYEPVCALVNIQCVTTPCNPVEETYGNSCKACQNSLVASYKEGGCKE